MNDTIDLAAVARRLLRRWPVIVIMLVVGALTGWAVSLALQPQYEAETTVVVTTPKLRTDFDSRFRSTLDLSLNAALNNTFFNLAKNRELEARVVQSIGGYLADEEKVPGGLLPHIEAVQIGGDTSYFKIRARYGDAETARVLANTWATEYADQINELYGMPQTTRAEVVASLDNASASVRAAEDKLQAFQQETGMGLVDNVQYPSTLSRQSGLGDARNLFGLYERYGAAGDALGAKNVTLGQYLVARDTLAILIEQATSMLPASNARGDDLPLALLESNEILTNDDRLVRSDLSSMSVSDVHDVLTRVAVGVDTVIDMLQADVDELLAVLAERNRRLTELIRERQLAEESYIILALKLSEIDTASDVEDSWLQLVSMAQLPEAPASPDRMLSTLVGGALGALIGAVVALALAVRSSPAQESDARED